MSKPIVTPAPMPKKQSIAVYAYATTDVVVFWDPSENSTYSIEVAEMAQADKANFIS